METLKALLHKEGNYRLPDELMTRFLESMTEVQLKPKEPIIKCGTLNSDVYIVKSGIVRLVYFEGVYERTFGFAPPGTMLLSPHSYYMRLPAFLQVESCKHSVVMKISKAKLDAFISESHEFAQWMYSLAMGQLFTSELKISLINGTAKERFIALIQNRPDLIENVSSRVIASYLGVTPSYLCHLKRELSKPLKK